MPTEQKILEEIFKIHKRQLKHLNVKNKKLLVCFSGIHCTGKTALVKILEKEYNGIRVSTDELRKIIKKLGRQKYPGLLDEIHKEEILQSYIFSFLKNYPLKNGLVLLDKGIDRNYEKISSTAKQSKFKIFLIRIIASKKTAKKGVIAKLGKPDKNFTRSINRWVKEYKQFGKTHKFDLKLKNNIIKPFNTEKIFAKLDKVVK